MKYIKYTCHILFGMLSLIFVSCSNHVTKHKTTTEYVIYPSPPDPARIQFLTSISSSINASTQRSGFSKFILGEQTPKPIKKPYGVTIRDGKIYVCDSGLGGLEIIDLQKKSFDYFTPEGKGQLKLPLNCFVENDGYLYVADGERRQIVVYDGSGNYISCFGEAEKFKPTDVFVYGDKIWVTDLFNNCICVYQKDNYKLLFKFPDTETGESGKLYQPTNLFIKSDKVYVSDMGDFNIKIYTLDGQFIKAIGSHGVNIGQLVRPKGIAVDHESNLYVVDASFENVQIFDEEGHLLMFFGGPYKGPGDMWLPAKVAIDYDNLSYFQKYVDPAYNLKYVIFVTNQYGPDKLNVYGAVEPKQ